MRQPFLPRQLAGSLHHGVDQRMLERGERCEQLVGCERVDEPIAGTRCEEELATLAQETVATAIRRDLLIEQVEDDTLLIVIECSGEELFPC